MSNLGMVQADSSGNIVHVLSFPHELKDHKAAPGVAQTLMVALTETNVAKLRAIVNDAGAHTLVGGVVKKGADAVTFEDGDDSHAAEKFLRGLTTAQRNSLRAGAKAVVTGLNAGSSDVEKAIGWLVVQRLEDG